MWAGWLVRPEEKGIDQQINETVHRAVQVALEIQSSDAIDID